MLRGAALRCMGRCGAIVTLGYLCTRILGLLDVAQGNPCIRMCSINTYASISLAYYSHITIIASTLFFAIFSARRMPKFASTGPCRRLYHMASDRGDFKLVLVCFVDVDVSDQVYCWPRNTQPHQTRWDDFLHYLWQMWRAPLSRTAREESWSTFVFVP
jgi:hypothetical protein